MGGGNTPCCVIDKRKMLGPIRADICKFCLLVFSDGGLKKTDLLEDNVHADGIHMWCCNANGSDSPLFGILVILTDFLMYFN
jgi:hypothetical protein